MGRSIGSGCKGWVGRFLGENALHLRRSRRHVAKVDGEVMSATAEQRIFISYRRSDCQSRANGLNDGLRHRHAISASPTTFKTKDPPPMFR